MSLRASRSLADRPKVSDGIEVAVDAARRSELDDLRRLVADVPEGVWREAGHVDARAWPGDDDIGAGDELVRSA